MWLNEVGFTTFAEGRKEKRVMLDATPKNSLRRPLLSPRELPQSQLYGTSSLQSPRPPTLYAPTRVKQWQSALYDIFTVVLFTGDVVLDILITVEFYNNGESTFFWGSVVIFAVAQIAYCVLFMHVFIGDDRGMVALFVTFVMLLPFAQLVPFIMYLSSFDCRVLDNVLKCLKFDPDSSGTKEKIDPDKEPWKAFINSKIAQHGGFLAESIVESVPQSLLQLIALVVRTRSSNHAIQALSLISVCTSILSVASRGLMVRQQKRWFVGEGLAECFLCAFFVWFHSLYL